MERVVKCGWCSKPLPKFCLWRGFHIKCYYKILEDSTPYIKVQKERIEPKNFKIKSSIN